MSCPQHSNAGRLRLTSLVIGLGAVLTLTGCSAGQVTETDTQVAAVNGASGTIDGRIAVRNAEFTFPTEHDYYAKGDSAPIQVVLVNEGTTDDRLVKVSSTYATSAQVGGTTEMPSRTALRALGQTTPSAEGHQSDQPTVTITLQGLKSFLRPGVTVPVTFTFEKAGAITVQVPIAASPAPRPAGHGEGH